MTYTHIKIEMIPQKLNEDFTKNCDIADQQKRLAESAPDMLNVLKVVERLLSGKARIDSRLVEEIVREVIANAEGK